MNNHVTSLELSKKLKELGVKQESEFYWVKDMHGITKLYFSGNPISAPIEVIYPYAFSAFLSSELGEMLPARYTIERLEFGTYACSHGNDQFQDHTEADARAKMLVYLLENNLMEL